MGDAKQSSANAAYSKLREKILTFALVPSQHLNEVALAQELNVSRTPLREAVNRLAAEGMLVAADRGFAVPKLDPSVVCHLFEVRSEIECSAVRLANQRSSAEDLRELAEFADESAAASPELSVDELVKLDRHFHEQLARLSGNPELLRILQNLNDRIHLVRWVAMEGRRNVTQGEHQRIIAALCERDEKRAEELMREHIMHRKEEIFAAVMKAYAHAHAVHFTT